MFASGNRPMRDDSAAPRASMSRESMSGSIRPPLPSSSMTLLLRAQQGDERARNELCARYLPRLRRWAHGRLPGWARDHLDTEDIVQDTLLSSIRRLERFSPNHEQAFCAYLCQAIRNRVSDAVRRANRRPVNEALSSGRPTSAPSPFELAVGEEIASRYDQALLSLRESDRELIIARVELGLDYSEITDLAGKSSVGSTRVAVSRALLRLAGAMGHDREP
jgi:RNA polymerase sigma factor (sigma-70 family)